MSIGAHTESDTFSVWGRREHLLDRVGILLRKHDHGAKMKARLQAFLVLADVLISDAPDDDQPPSDIGAALREGECCLAYLLSSQAQEAKGARCQPIAIWVEQATSVEGDYIAVRARRTLGCYGLKVLVPIPGTDEKPPQPLRLAIANRHKGLATLFEASHWLGRPNAMGAWVQDLRCLPGATSPRKPEWFGGATCKCVTIPLSIVLLSDDMSGSEALKVTGR